ncbi:ComF family protein [Candidatus Saccharibacteria bacterium]|nr:ComF family protein [Candidatus Saccharibacteria bacterium]
MKNNVVKKSIFEKILDVLLPYYCRGCGKTGSLLCENCLAELEVPIRDFRGKEVELGEIEELFVGGWREGVLRKLVEDYKFKSVKKISGILAGILDETVPLEMEAVVVPLPTISQHIRQRGFDHAKRLAEEFAKLRGSEVSEVLVRKNNTVQVGANEEMRRRQAEEAYEVDFSKFEAGKVYLLVDDVWTTGASMRAAAKKLRQAGAERVFAATVEIGLAI